MKHRLAKQKLASAFKGDINQNIPDCLQLDHPVRAFAAIQRGQLIARRGGGGLGRSVISLVSSSRANWNSRLTSGNVAAIFSSPPWVGWA